LRPGGAIAILVDSLVALACELLRSGRVEEAFMRLKTRHGIWVLDDISAEHHLFDARSLGESLRQTGFVDVDVLGLLVGWTVHGRRGMIHRLESQWSAQMAQERRLARDRCLADMGKQLLAFGFRRH
jgi:hypothetical protein